MAAVTAPRILVCTGDPAAAAELRSLLEPTGQVVVWNVSDPEPNSLTDHQLVVLDGGWADQELFRSFRRIRVRWSDHFVPTLFVAGAQSSSCVDGLEAGADCCLPRPFVPAELPAQVRALLRIKEQHDRLADKAAEMQRVNKRLQVAHQRLNDELEFASRIQHSLLPQSLPDIGPVRFAVHYQPCGQVGGDFYDVFRLDESHIGFYVADAMGHGLPACLLTIFLKKAVRAKEIFGKQYRLVPPDEVLQRLNRDLLDQGLADNPFITMVYGLLDFREGSLQFARAGHPYPIHVPPDQDPQLWPVEGSLLGVFETRYVVRHCRLRSGDKVLFHTDGTDDLTFEGRSAGISSLLACSARHRARPVGEFVEYLARDLHRETPPVDDFTLLGLEIKE